MPRKTLHAVLVAIAAALTVPALATAKTNIAVGIGDQDARMFDNVHFQALKVKKARYFIRWNAIDDPRLMGLANEWLAGARRRGVRPLFHLDGLDIEKKTRPPSVAQYRRKVRALRRAFPSVREWGVWNEANSPTQPVYRLSGARRTAKYFLALRSVCRGCTIVALDLLDGGRNLRGYIRTFYRALGRRKGLAKIVGIHNYGDTNRRRNNTRTIINSVRRYNRRAKFWMTETGGIALLQTERDGRLVPSRGLGCDPANMRAAERRQAKAVAKMFRLARKYRRHVQRLYPFNFYSTDCDRSLRFDAGIIRRDGSKRPAYNTLRRAMRSFKR